MNNKINALILLVFFTIGLLISFLSFSAFNNHKSDKPAALEANNKTDNSNTIEANSMPENVFGIPSASYEVEKAVVQRNEFLSTILERYQISAVTIAELAKQSKSVFNVRNIAVGKPYTVLLSKSNPGKADYFIYEPNATEYIVYDLRDEIRVTKEKKHVDTKIETIGGTINSSLYEALQLNGGDPNMAVHLSNIFGGVINFFSIKEGDWFKIQYERNYVDDKPIDAGKILSAVFSHNGKEYEAHYFQPDNDVQGEYYDENGNSLRRSFLKAPLKFVRISSRFSKRRLHPVQKVWKAHLGTDFAAPTGTPIVSTGDGVVVESQFTRSNGNYVKVKHNNTYTTQYLHMSRRAVKRGQRVKQGEVIGYVGSTGLATGPHVCYRFWKNGKQVDPLRLNIKMAAPLPEKYKDAFQNHIDYRRMELATIPTENGVDKKRYALYEEKPSELFKYFGIKEESANTI